jgi:ABC-2 type transport system ATP-binding protein
MIEVAGLTKHYGDKPAVDGLSFTVRPGRVTGFLGPNGSGKSTTMRIILGLAAPDGGGVTINGRPYQRLPAPLREVGSLLDARAAHPGRTAYNHLLCIARGNRIPRRRVDEVIELVGLTGVADNRVKGFSLGMAQRLGIATALLGDPGILLLDEPVNGLDTEGIRWIRGLMRELAAEGRTIFVSSHLMSEMELTADHLIVIGQGRLLADTAMRAFIERNSQSYTLVRSQQDQTLRRVLEAAGATLHLDPQGGWQVRGLEPATIGALAADHQIALSELSPHLATLEEVYTRMTQGRVDYRAGTPTTAIATAPDSAEHVRTAGPGQEP